jgi:hypothetical protein
LTDPPAGSSFRFLFDEHVNAKAMERLRAGGVDVLSVAEIGLAGADDGTVFDRARRDGRIVVTRNYQDVAPLVTEAGRRAISFSWRSVPGQITFASGRGWPRPRAGTVDRQRPEEGREPGGGHLRMALPERVKDR